MSQTPGEIRFAGKKPGSDTLSVLADIGVSEEDLVELRSIGVI
jgi:crotonobetainyl-CoA:carnitine CoA-transferase CaiB-like acyl-CoA transferase